VDTYKQIMALADAYANECKADYDNRKNIATARKALDEAVKEYIRTSAMETINATLARRTPR
jgi:hypothetical protein